MQSENSTISSSSSTKDRPKTRKRIIFTKFFTKLLQPNKNQAKVKPNQNQSTTTTTAVNQPAVEDDDDKLPTPIPPVITPEIRAKVFPIKKITEDKWVID